MIKEKETILKLRAAPEVYIKYKDTDGLGSHLVREKKQELYKYYKCDYCGEEIEIKANKIEQTGGTLEFKGMTLALCNKCLKEVLKEYE